MNNNNLKLIDKIFLALIWIPFPTISITLIFWWSGYLLGFKDQLIGIVFVGLILGIFLCILTFKKFLQRAYNQNKWLLICLYLFYMIGIFGFFMGVPVFNIIPGILAGIYFTRKAIYSNSNMLVFKNLMKRIQIIMAIGLTIICACSAYIALNDPFTGVNIKGMLNLPFDVTQVIIWGIILIGGFTMLIIQFLAIRFINRNHNIPLFMS